LTQLITISFNITLTIETPITHGESYISPRWPNSYLCEIFQ